jgi:hypothetical protein
MEVVHIDVCSPWCEVKHGVFSIFINDSNRCMVYLLDEIEVWNDWNWAIYEVEIVVIRIFKLYDLIIK